ncbi:translation initiation factor IF-2 [bacterium]|nr:translation initiation factor IF-2 [bacterium]
MPDKKTYRINKVATEFNVSWKTIVEHLQSKGFEVESKITAKIDQDMYNELLSFYQKDKAAKEESQQLEINIRKDAKTQDIKEVKKTPPKNTEFDRGEILIKDSNLTNKGTDKEEPSKEEKKEEKKPVEEKKEEPKQEEKKEEVKSEPKKEEPKAEEPKEEKESRGPKVLGTIDLPPKKGSKKEEPKKEEPKKEEPKAEEPKKEEAKKEESKEEKKAEPVKDDKDSKQEEEDKEQIETQYKKLQGTKVLGSIELPKPVKKDKSKDNKDTGPKKKRKRIRGEKITPEKLKQEQRRNPNKKRTDDKSEISEKEIQDKIKKTLARMSGQGGGGGGRNRQKARRQRRDDHRQTREEQQLKDELQSKVLQVTEFVTANELANMMNVNVTEVISACFSLGMMVSINQRLDAETLQIVADEFGYTVDFVDASETIEIEIEEDDPADLKPRHPIVTVMGHVDHGKTSLLDYIRSANVIAGEAGGITQHVAAYEVNLKEGQKITFIDTPGHEAFTAMRARGAKVTDIAIIVIAADDAVMPQTKEAISHAQAADVPIVFAFNKIDKDGANADRVREQLSQMNILVEDWGGKYQSQEISAKKGLNIEELLEKVLLEAELLELKANPDKHASGGVLEARLEKGRGVVASLLVQEGTLKIGDPLVAGKHFARIKAMFNERGQAVDKAGPATPVSVLGFSGTPAAGDTFQVMEDEQRAKEIAQKREQLQREQGIRATKHITLEEIGRRLAVGNFKELNVIIKADVDGSAEALSDSLIKLSTEEIQVNVIHKSVGPISDNDVMLATASDAIIIGFQVRPMPTAKKLAEHEEIEIRQYSVIYQAIEEIKSAMEGMLDPDLEEQITGTAEIREVFKISKVGTVAGCMVIEGKMFRDNKVRLIRDGVVIYTGELASLKRFKDDVKEVNKGYECGMQIQNYNDIREGDLIEGFKEVEVKRKLK